MPAPFTTTLASIRRELWFWRAAIPPWVCWPQSWHSVADLRLLVFPRSSRAALELLARGLVHAAGVHLARSDQEEGNAASVVPHLAAARGQDFQLLRLADWEEGIALAPALQVTTVRGAVAARLRWVGREPGSAARECLDELLGKPTRNRPTHTLHCARDHRGVADAIQASWADAGVCLRLTSEEANLSFLSVRTRPTTSASRTPWLATLACGHCSRSRVRPRYGDRWASCRDIRPREPAS